MKRNSQVILSADENRLLRPENFPKHTPGSGFGAHFLKLAKENHGANNVAGRLVRDPLDDVL